MDRRRGHTLVELVVGMGLAAVVLAIAVPSVARPLDRAAVHAATRDLAGALAAARDHAVATGRRTAVRLDPVRGRVVVHAGADTLERHNLATTWGVRLATSRESTAYAPNALGWGTANLTARITRGAAADTLTVSRLGRVSR